MQCIYLFNVIFASIIFHNWLHSSQFSSNYFIFFRNLRFFKWFTPCLSCFSYKIKIKMKSEFMHTPWTLIIIENNSNEHWNTFIKIKCWCLSWMAVVRLGLIYDFIDFVVYVWMIRNHIDDWRLISAFRIEFSTPVDQLVCLLSVLHIKLKTFIRFTRMCGNCLNNSLSWLFALSRFKEFSNDQTHSTHIYPHTHTQTYTD